VWRGGAVEGGITVSLHAQPKQKSHYTRRLVWAGRQSGSSPIQFSDSLSFPRESSFCSTPASRTLSRAFKQTFSQPKIQIFQQGKEIFEEWDECGLRFVNFEDPPSMSNMRPGHVLLTVLISPLICQVKSVPSPHCSKQSILVPPRTLSVPPCFLPLQKSRNRFSDSTFLLERERVCVCVCVGE